MHNNCVLRHGFLVFITEYYCFYCYVVIERKTYRADIDRLRPRIFCLALLFNVVLFVVVLNIRWTSVSDALLDNILEDASIDMDLLPALQRDDQNIIAATHEEPKSTDKINKVDKVVEKTEIESIKDQMVFTPSEAGDADKLKDSENEPIAPAITNMNGEELPLRVVEQLPEFPGGMSHFMQWLNTALRYPATAKTKKIQGTVMVSFVVEKDGRTTNHKLVKTANNMLDAEAMRVIRMMPKWKPAQDHGKNCRSVVAVPIVFAL